MKTTVMIILVVYLLWTGQYSCLVRATFYVPILQCNLMLESSQRMLTSMEAHHVAYTGGSLA